LVGQRGREELSEERVASIRVSILSHLLRTESIEHFLVCALHKTLEINIAYSIATRFVDLVRSNPNAIDFVVDAHSRF